MAKPIESVLVGIDVSKAELVVARSDSRDLEKIANSSGAIRRWLKALPSGSKVALEATGTYHRALATLAHQAGFELYLLDGYRLNRYRDGVGNRAKTDPADARLILRYLSKELSDLKPWMPPHEAFYRIQSLMRRRASLVHTRVALTQSLGDVPELKSACKRLGKNIMDIEKLIERYLKEAMNEVGWWPDAKRCMAIEGIGDLTSVALANTFHRGAFKNSDAFVAYLGMDVRVRDSGKQVGRRKLTKKGDPELRRLLYNAAMSASRTRAWTATYGRYLNQGMKTTQAFVKLARKLARIAFALMKNQSTYLPKVPARCCGEP
jgi:transposase